MSEIAARPDWVKERAAEIDEIISRYPQRRSALMPLLHLAQDVRGHVADEDLEAIAEILGETKAYVESVCSFYSLYHRKPVGKYVITVCNNITCGLSGAEAAVAHLEKRLGIKAGETTPDGLFTLLITGECIAACDGAPAAQVNLQYCNVMSPERIDAILDALRGGADPAEVADTLGALPSQEAAG